MGMSKYRAMVAVPRPSFDPKKPYYLLDMRWLAVRRIATLGEVHAWVARNRETWRGALLDHEDRFVVLLFDKQATPLPLCILVLDRTFGSAGVAVGRDDGLAAPIHRLTVLKSKPYANVWPRASKSKATQRETGT